MWNLIFILFVWLLSIHNASSNPEISDPEHPNIIFIFADDLGYGDLSCYNPQSKITTPNIDRLAMSGMRFTDAHAPAAVCIPSRYALLTGHYPFLNHRKYQEGVIQPGRPTLASVLKAAGYQTACIGKWHQGIVNEKNPPPDSDLLGGPLDHGFDYFYGIPASLDIQPYYYIENNRPVKLPVETIAPMEGIAPSPGKRKIQGPFYRGGKVAPGFEHEKVLDHFSEKAFQYIKNQNQRKQRSFFLYLALPAPHTPWLPTSEFRGTSGAGAYGDFVLQVDHLVGNVLKTLDDQQITNNTLIIFTSDNGPVWYPENVARYDHNAVGPLSGMKGDAWEGGHRLPLIAKWPGKIKAGTVNHHLISFTDIMSTFANLVDLDLSSDYANNSISILPMLLDPDHPAIRTTFVMKSSKGTYSIRKNNWKLILAKGSGGFMDTYDPDLVKRNPYDGQLYNLSTDMGEMKNLYAENSEMVETLRAELENVLKGN